MTPEHETGGSPGRPPLLATLCFALTALRRTIDVVAILGARGIGLGAAERPEIDQMIQRLAPQKVLQGVKDRCRVGLDRHPVLGP